MPTSSVLTGPAPERPYRPADPGWHYCASEYHSWPSSWVEVPIGVNFCDECRTIYASEVAQITELMQAQAPLDRQTVDRWRWLKEMIEEDNREREKFDDNAPA